MLTHLYGTALVHIAMTISLTSGLFDVKLKGGADGVAGSLQWTRSASLLPLH